MKSEKQELIRFPNIVISLVILSCSSNLISGLASAQTSAQPTDKPSTSASETRVGPWQAMLDQDLAFIHDTLNVKYIYALDPGGPDWDRLLATATEQAHKDAQTVKDASGYRAVISRFIGAFEDPHLRPVINFVPRSYDWPKFLVRYIGGKYVVVETQTALVVKGATVTACDGTPIDKLVDRIAPLEGYVVGSESTKASIAEILFVNAKSPIYPRPAKCRIGEKDVSLEWTQISGDSLAVLSAPHNQLREKTISISEFGKNGAWVRLGIFAPGNKIEADQFHDIIDRAPTLRNKDIVVLDVRGNGGGPYNWFMGFLRSLYGAAYTDYYARARLEITPIFVPTPELTAPTPRESRPDPFGMPPDPELDASLKLRKEIVTSSGAKVIALANPNENYHRPPQAPDSPVRARVFVLTDYGCGSACVSFVDEMLRFPGVKQIVLETYIDRRSGSPLPYPLPSGNGVVIVPSMVRSGRQRGENIPLIPTYKFNGEISDTATVKAWVSDVIVKTDP